MTTEQLIALHERICEKARDLMRRKNHDYSGEEKTFANFERVEAMGICSIQQGFFVRLCDKFSRLITLTQTGENLVKDESIEDTLIDMVNYPILFAGWRMEQLEKQQRNSNDNRKNNRRQHQLGNSIKADNIRASIPKVHSRRSDDSPVVQQKRRKLTRDPDKALSRASKTQSGHSHSLGKQSEWDAG